jgi:CheY-like chemotaxis protein
MEEDIQRYKSLGFNAHIGKPIIMQQLYESIGDALHR